MFNWFKKKPAPEKKHVPELHGYRLDEWEFLGVTPIEYVDDLKTSVATCEVFFFMKKNDPDWREITLTHKSKWASFKELPFVRLRAELWKANQLKIYESINIPSEYLKDYMLDVYSVEWSMEQKWWVSTDKAKYNKSVRQQNTKPKTVETESTKEPDTKVVKVDFTKKT